MKAYLKHAETGEWIEVPVVNKVNEDGSITLIETAYFPYTDVRIELTFDRTFEYSSHEKR